MWLRLEGRADAAAGKPKRRSDAPCGAPAPAGKATRWVAAHMEVREGRRLLRLACQGQTYEVWLDDAPGPGPAGLAHAGQSGDAQIRALGGGPAAGLGPQRAPMAGRVTSVEVEVGQRVEAGAPLVALEAMKMEHWLRAPVAGEVISVSCRPGQVAQTQTVLLELGPSKQ